MTDDKATIAVQHLEREEPVNLENLASDLGLSVKFTDDLDNDIAGMIERNPNDSYTISVNASLPPALMNFTLAHEIGHFVLHEPLICDGLDDTRAYLSTDKGKYHNRLVGKKEEREATIFAINFLMPVHLIKKYQKEGMSVESMAQKLSVSKKTLEIRLNEL